MPLMRLSKLPTNTHLKQLVGIRSLALSGAYFLVIDKIGDLEKRVEVLELQVNKKIVSRLFFVELKSINSVPDTLNNCFYQSDKNADYDIDTEYRLDDVSDEWWESLSLSDLEVVNKMKKL